MGLLLAAMGASSICLGVFALRKGEAIERWFSDQTGLPKLDLWPTQGWMAIAMGVFLLMFAVAVALSGG
jgi:hypothetical protein